VEVKIHAFLTSALGGGRWFHALAMVPSGKETPISTGQGTG